MKFIKYFLEYLFISLFFFIFKKLGYEKSSDLGEKIGKLIGPLFRSKQKILSNLKFANIYGTVSENEKFISEMWGNYGRIFSEYPFMKDFKNSFAKKYINIKGIEVLEKLKKENKKAVFISGHFNNFELMAMQIAEQGINLATIYRPLNNIFLNKKMEVIRRKYVCKNQIKKGIPGTREVIKYSIALMIDQRVSEGIHSKFYNKYAYTTTIPAQLYQKYDCEIVPVYIERVKNYYFNIYFYDPVNLSKNSKIDNITNELNIILEKLILKNPTQWIWTHDRWK